MKPSLLGMAVLGLAASLPGCVSADSMHADVRRLTAARIDQDAQWDEHGSASAARDRTRKLLGQPLTADSAVQIALLNNRTLQAAFEELGVAGSQVRAAYRLPNPTLDAALRYRGGESGSPSIDLDALIDISDLLLLPLSGGAATAELEAAKVSVAGSIIDLAFDTRIAFYAYQAAEGALELRRDVLAALRASFDAAQALYDAGNITELNYASERALYEEAKLAYTSAEATTSARREELNALMGTWGVKGAEWTAAGRLPPPDASPSDLRELEARAVERSLDLELNRRRFAAMAGRVNFERARGWVPELGVGVSAERESEAGSEWAIGPAIALEVPLFYQGQGEVGAAIARMQQIQHSHGDLAVRVRASARAAALRLEAATERATYYHRVLLPLRQRIVDQTQLQFNAMNVGVFQLLQAKREQIETGRAYVETLLEYWTARARVEQLLAGRLPPGLGSSGPSETSSAAPGQAPLAH